MVLGFAMILVAASTGPAVILARLIARGLGF